MFLPRQTKLPFENRHPLVGIAPEDSSITMVGSERLLIACASGGDCRTSSEVIQEKDVQPVASF
jgi:hypothetical protein